MSDTHRPEYPRITIYRDALVLQANADHEAVIPLAAIEGGTTVADSLDATTSSGTVALTLLYSHMSHHAFERLDETR